MPELLKFVVLHGYALVFAWVFVEQGGLPIPSAPLLLAVGALSGVHQMNLGVAITFAVSKPVEGTILTVARVAASAAGAAADAGADLPGVLEQTLAAAAAAVDATPTQLEVLRTAGVVDSTISQPSSV